MAAESDAVASYKDIAFSGAWSSRARGLWGGSVTGLIFGALVGLVAPVFPAIAGAPLAAAIELIPASVAIFSAIGMGLGFGAGALVGATSGAAASVAEEQERREKAQGRKIEKTLSLPPGTLSREADAGKAPAAPETFGRKLKNELDTYVNLRIGAVFTGLGVAGGLVMAAAFISAGGLTGGIDAAVPAMKLLLGETASKSAVAVTTYFAGVMGSFGALWSFNFPKIATDLSHFMGGLSNGKLLGTQWGPAPEKAPQPEVAPVINVEAAPEQQASVRLRKYQSFQELVAQKTSDNSPELFTRG